MWAIGLVFIIATVVLLSLVFLVGFRRLVRHVRQSRSHSNRPNILHGATFWLSGIFFIVAFVAIGFFWEALGVH